MAAKHWCFTINNYTSEDMERLRVLTERDTEYLVFGKETGSSGTPHLQGYLCLKTKKTMASVKKLIGSNPHLEKKRGSAKQASDYCKKDGDFEEYGVLNDQGKRNDLKDFMDDVKNGNTDLKELYETHPDVCARYGRFAREYVNLHREIPELPNHPLRNWQQLLNDYLKQEPDDRKITFVVDRKGNEGKTWFAKYYCRLHKNAQYMEMAKKADMAHALDPDLRVLFVNCTRQQIEYLNYSFLEAVKDGMVFSPKYESGMKILGKVHVVVMMNEMPDPSALSADRYNYIDLN